MRCAILFGFLFSTLLFVSESAAQPMGMGAWKRWECGTGGVWQHTAVRDIKEFVTRRMKPPGTDGFVQLTWTPPPGSSQPPETSNAVTLPKAAAEWDRTIPATVFHGHTKFRTGTYEFKIYQGVPGIGMPSEIASESAVFEVELRQPNTFWLLKLPRGDVFPKGIPDRINFYGLKASGRTAFMKVTYVPTAKVSDEIALGGDEWHEKLEPTHFDIAWMIFKSGDYKVEIYERPAGGGAPILREPPPGAPDIKFTVN